MACRISITQLGTEHEPQQWRPRNLPERPSGNFHVASLYSRFKLFLFWNFSWIIGWHISSGLLFWFASLIIEILDLYYLPSISAIYSLALYTSFSHFYSLRLFGLLILLIRFLKFKLFSLGLEHYFFFNLTWALSSINSFPTFWVFCS